MVSHLFYFSECGHYHGIFAFQLRLPVIIINASNLSVKFIILEQLKHDQTVLSLS